MRREASLEICPVLNRFPLSIVVASCCCYSVSHSHTCTNAVLLRTTFVVFVGHHPLARVAPNKLIITQRELGFFSSSLSLSLFPLSYSHSLSLSLSCCPHSLLFGQQQLHSIPNTSSQVSFFLTLFSSLLSSIFGLNEH